MDTTITPDDQSMMTMSNVNLLTAAPLNEGDTETVSQHNNNEAQTTLTNVTCYLQPDGVNCIFYAF